MNSPIDREYPAAPVLGVGALIVDGPRVLLVKRGRPPALGRWSIPGGLVDVGEPVEAAVRREVAEECGLTVQTHGLVGIVDRIVRDAVGRVQYHYVLLDFLATPDTGAARAGSDARALRWSTPDDLAGLDTTEGLEPMVRRALAMNAARLRQEADG
ncbi:MAG: NUDIX hydrolase [Candidatus Rokuibacteriota bacterium]